MAHEEALYRPVAEGEVSVTVTAHAQSQGLGLRRSHTNYMFNQTGHFADAGHAFAKALFFGGVTARFPDLKFAFLECGACVCQSAVLRGRDRPLS